MSGRGEASRAAVSVVMPVWKPTSAWFEEAIRSVLADDAVLELIVVDDGGDPPVAVPLVDPRLRLVRAPHGGPYAARDAGIAEACAPFIRFADADDRVAPGSTGRLLAASLAGDGPTISYGWTTMCDEELTPVREIVERSEGDVLAECLVGNFDVFHVSMLFPRSVVDSAGPCACGVRVSGDWDFVLRAVEHAPVRRIDESVTSYRRHPDSVMSSAALDDGVAARGEIISRFAARHPERSSRRLIRRARGAMHLDAAVAHAYRGERGAAAQAFASAVVLTPVPALRRLARVAWERVGRGHR